MDPPQTSAPASRPRLEVLAIGAWAVLALGITLRMLLAPDPAHNNVYLKVFAPAARAFVEQRDLYANTGFRYPPLCAALFLPFELCGDRLGSALWRWLNFAVLGAGVLAAFRAGFPIALQRSERALFLLLLLALELGSLNNGQPNPLIVGLLLCATVRASRAGLAAPASAITGCTAIKIYPLAYGMVLATLRPKLVPWLLAGLCLAALLPFALRDPGYVASQYRALAEMLGNEDRTRDLSDAYRDLRLLAAVVDVPINRGAYLTLQVLGGLGIVGLCRSLRLTNTPRRNTYYFAFGLTSCWFMLLGPATELSTYSLLGPTLPWGLLLALRGTHKLDRVLWIAASGLALLSHIPVSRTLQSESPWLRTPLPLAAALAAAGLIADGLRTAKSRPTKLPSPEPSS